MNQDNKRTLDLSLILPLSLLILEIIVIIVLLTSGYEITQFLIFLFILLGAFLVLQVGRQMLNRWRINQAVVKIKEGQILMDAGHNLQAIQLWKSLLFSLPKEHFFDVLQRIESAYEKEEMEEAIQQIQAIKAESKDFFQMTRNLQKATAEDRRDWQARAFKLQNMIKALPEKPGQDLSDTKPE
ncbi:MAG: hypothetical protein ACOCYU_00180 [Brevefilum sp.]